MSVEKTAAAEAERQEVLAALMERVPYNGFIGCSFERMGDELTARLPFSMRNVGNPMLPAIHGGVIGAFLEITAHGQLSWSQVQQVLDGGGAGAEEIRTGKFPPLPKTIDVSIDYLRSGRPRTTYARATVQKRGRRVANVHVTAWQDERDRPIAMLRGNFLMPD
ncbi:MAG: PaaI family thioesterase [Pseudomonadota bacterium]